MTTQWLLLLLSVPAIVVPVVMLYGFSGCKFEPGAASPPTLDPPATPTNLTATATDLDRVTLTWEHLAQPMQTVTFHITRTGGDPGLPAPVSTSATTYEDTGLAEGTMYIYQVKAVRGSDGAESGLSEPAGATTLSWKTIFTTEGIPPNPSNGTDAANDTIVQRVNGVSSGGIFARVALRGIVNETTVLTSVTISKAVPAGAPQPWNSADPPVPVTFGGAAGVTLPNGAVAVSDKISYSVTQGEDLLAAFDVGGGSGRILRRNLTGALAFVGNNRAEAGLMNRTAGYNQDEDRAYCIEKIEVA